MKYISVILTSSQGKQNYYVSPDKIPLFYEEVIQEFTNDCKVTFKGKVDLGNEHRKYFKYGE